MGWKTQEYDDESYHLESQADGPEDSQGVAEMRESQVDELIDSQETVLDQGRGDKICILRHAAGASSEKTSR